MCNISNSSFRVPFIFPLPIEIYGFDQLIPFKHILSLRHIDNQLNSDKPKYESIHEYILDLENNNYDDINGYHGTIKDLEKEIKTFIYGFNTSDGCLIHHPNHIHFRHISNHEIYNNIPIDNGFVHDYDEDFININTPYLLDVLGTFCPEHNSISVDITKVSKLIENIANNGLGDFHEEDLVYIVAMHEYGHYLSQNTSITLGDEDFVRVRNHYFQEIFAQIVCCFFVIKKGCNNIVKLFKLIIENQPEVYRLFENSEFLSFTEKPNSSFLPYFLYLARHTYLINQDLKLEDLQYLAKIDYNNIIANGKLNNEILGKVQTNLEKNNCLSFYSGGLIIDMFPGYYFCCDPKRDPSRAGQDP